MFKQWYFFLLICFSFTTQSVFAQHKSTIYTIDSLYSLLHKSTEGNNYNNFQIDTARLNLLNNLCTNLVNKGFYDNVDVFYKKNIDISKKIGFLKGEQNAYNSLGNLYSNKKDFGTAQTSLQKAIELGKQIENKRFLAISYNSLGINYLRQSNLTKADESFINAILIYTGLGDKVSVASIHRTMGLMYKDESIYPKALEHLSKAVSIYEAIGDKINVARNLGSIGITYYDQSNYPKALENHLKALFINEKLQNKEAVGRNYMNIGNVYYKQTNYPKAFEYYKQSLNIAESFGDNSSIAKSLINIGIAYHKQPDYPKAIEYYNKAAKLFESEENKSGMGTAFGNIGSVYETTIDYKKAMEFYVKALNIFKEINDPDGIARHTECVGKVYLKMAKQSNVNTVLKKEYLQKAINNLDTAAKLFQSISALDEYQISLADLSEAYELNTEFDKSLITFKEHIKYRDSVFNEEKSYELTRRELDYTYSKKEDSIKIEAEKKELQLKKEMALKAIKVEYEKKQALAKTEKERQQLKYEQQIKEQKINLEYNQKIAIANAKEKSQMALNKILAKDNELMNKNRKNEIIIRWLMLFGLISVVAFAVVSYKNFKKQKAANLQIAKQSDDLKMLLQELHHRVKNNLQLISSLLELQSLRLTDDNAKQAFEEGQSRVQSIAILHQQLYQHEDLSTIELSRFVDELFKQIAAAFKKPNQHLKIINALQEFYIDIEVALPLGLIINELATNSFKYAKPNNDELQLKVNLNKIDEKKYTLIYSDNGVGMPADFSLDKAKSLGMRIVNKLAKQIKGSSDYTYNNGSMFSINFVIK